LKYFCCFALTTLLLSACSPSGDSTESQAVAPTPEPAVVAADMVYTNAKAYTLDEAQPWAEAVAVRGDEIVYVGDNEGARKLIGSETEVRNLDGKMLLPGFIETHMHLGGSLAFINAAVLSPTMSKEELLATIAKHADSHPDQDPIIGMGFLGANFGDIGPTAADLDEIVSDRAVFMFDEGGHTAWVNSVSLERAGIDSGTVDPVPGVHYFKRYEDGTPTGWLIEGGAFGPIAEKLKIVTKESLQAGADRFYPILSQFGLTAIFDAGITKNANDTLAILQDSAESGVMPLRLVASYYVNTAEKLPTAVETVKSMQEQYHHERFDFRVLKLSLDGTGEAHTAYLLEPWLGQEINTTLPLIPAEGATEAVLEAARENVDVHLHALGDGAVRLALDMVEQARKEFPETDSRFAMCHLQIVNPADVPRFAQLDVTAQTTPTWFGFDDIALEFLGQTRFEQMYPIHSIAAAGARLAFGSDFPATWIGLDGLNPLFNIEMAITRQPPGEADFPVQALESERVDLAQAIRAYTIDAAYQLRLEHLVGSLEVGKQADLVVLNDNLFDVDPYNIHQMRVLHTMMDGQVFYDELDQVAQ